MISPKLWMALLLPLVGGGCAHVHEGKIAEPINQIANGPPSAAGLKVSGKRVKLDGMPTFDLIEITLENESLDWFRINRTDVLIDAPGTSGLSMVVGKDLKD